MEELIRTNDLALISFIEALMKEAKLRYTIADANMSIMEGSLGVLPRRILVEAGEKDRAERILKEAGLSDELDLNRGH
ncbi:DUF2007 domain-containing protein [Afifella sp. IM 167]|uniref:putative signal transducing protein n=1 Tax=Afifella sp. IM 167 TaxID=2033586 RepID=UPI001CCFEC23|nr:DUF2007 domain-containing protein [Afifella sp. IM 167]MBZ8133376.1 hypothetical protein [Afifella sp. IM 167]